MADIPVANIGAWNWVSLGNKYLCISKVKGDGTGVTIPTPLNGIEAAWVQAIDDASANLPIVPVVSISTTARNGIVTYAAAPTINKYHWLFVIGTT